MSASNRKIRVAFIKFGGLAAGGTERWLQMMAANLPRDQFEVDYYYCDAAPYIGSDYKHADTDPDRLRYMQEHQVNLIKFHVGAKDITVPTHDWVDTDFWQKFDAQKYDLVQAGKAGHAEYPFHLLKLPVVEYVTLMAGVDRSPNLAWSIHLSQWQRRQWFRAGGQLDKSSVIPIPAEPPVCTDNLRHALGIPPDALVAGFHQRADNHIFSPIPLQAFAKLEQPDRHFIIMGGGSAYRQQTVQLGLKNVHFLDHSGDAAQISRFLNTLDIFAHGRRDGETFGAVLAEAMMHGLPCLSHPSLVNDNNAQPETMGPAGLFARDLDDYTDKLRALFVDNDLRARLAAKARPHAEAYYSLPACVEALSAVYRRLCGQSVPPTRPQAMPYGRSPLGFLQAGELEKPSSIAYHVLTGDIPEAFEVHITRFFLPHIRTFIDVGANIGLYCLLAAHECPAGVQVHAFEPQPECCATLQHTVHLNNWEDRLAVHCLGLGNAPGEFPLYLSGTSSTFDNAFNDYASLETIPARVDTLDNQVASLGIGQVDFIKIDVEGFEQQVLEGAVRTIERDRPVLFVEIADHVRGRSYHNPNYARTLHWLQERGYQLWRCTEDNRLVTADPDQPQDHLAMYLCLHKEAHAHWLQAILAWACEYRALKREENITRLANKILWGLRNPKLAARKVMSRLKHLYLRMASKAKTHVQTKTDSYKRHHAQFLQADSLEKHRIIFQKYEAENLFNHPENKLAGCLPAIRKYEVWPLTSAVGRAGSRRA